MRLIFIVFWAMLSVFFTPCTAQTLSSNSGETLVHDADSLLRNHPDESIKLAGKAFADFGKDPKVFMSSASLLSEAYRAKGNYDSAERYTRIGLQKALEIQDTAKIIHFFMNKGSDYYYKADYLKALEASKMSASYYRAFGFDKETDEISPLDYAKLLNNIGTAYIKTGHYDSSLVYFIEAVKVKEAHDAPARMMIVGKINIGSIYLAIKDYENGEVWLRQALTDAVLEKDSGYMARCYANLGVLYKKVGDTLKAIDNYKKGIAINEHMGDRRNLAIVCQNLALLLSSQKKYTEAYQCFSRALSNNNHIHANNSRLHLAMSRMFLEQKIYDSTVFHGKLAMSLAKENGNIDVQLEAFELLYQAYEGKRNFAEAFRFIKKYLFLKDSIKNKENQEYIQKLKTKFETERKENEILILKELNQSEHLKSVVIQSRQRMIIFIILLTLSLVIVGALYYFTKKKKEKELYLVEKKLLELDVKNKELARNELQAEVNFKTRQLTTHALNMVHKNQLLLDIREKLKQVDRKMGEDPSMEFKSIINDIGINQKTEKDWALFKNYFENVNKDFNTKLRAINPKLSTHDYRLAALISLNLNIKETAALLNISPNSVKIARHRLRKRLLLSPGDDLYVFLNKL